MKKKISILMVIFSVCCSVSFASELNKIVAVVNGEMISLHDLRNNTALELEGRKIAPGDARAAAVKQSVLETMIDNILFKQEAERYKISVTDADVEAETKRIMQGSGVKDEKEFEAQLLRQGVNLALFNEKMRANILRQRLLNTIIVRKIIVPEKDVQAYYEQHKDEFKEKQVDFGFIVFDKNTDAEKIHKQIKNKTLDFSQAAKNYSIDSSSANGGIFVNIPLMALPAGMQQSLMRLKQGEMSSLIPLDDKKGLLRLDKVHSGSALPLSRVQQNIEAKLRDQMAEEKIKEYSEQLRKRAVIDIRL